MSLVHTPRRFGGRVALAAFGALAAGAALVPGAALAQSSGPDGSSSGARPTPEKMEQRRQCLAENGVNLPAPQLDANGRPVRGQGKPQLTDEQKAAYKAAIEACGGPKGSGPKGFGPGKGNRPGNGHARPQLTDEQKSCLTEQGIELPSGPKAGDGKRPEPPTAEQREAMKAAAEACGLPTPKGGSQPAS